jgi:hypothetical protein
MMSPKEVEEYRKEKLAAQKEREDWADEIIINELRSLKYYMVGTAIKSNTNAIVAGRLDNIVRCDVYNLGYDRNLRFNSFIGYTGKAYYLNINAGNQETVEWGKAINFDERML